MTGKLHKLQLYIDNKAGDLRQLSDQVRLVQLELEQAERERDNVKQIIADLAWGEPWRRGGKLPSQTSDPDTDTGISWVESSETHQINLHSTNSELTLLTSNSYILRFFMILLPV